MSLHSLVAATGLLIPFTGPEVLGNIGNLPASLPRLDLGSADQIHFKVLEDSITKNKVRLIPGNPDIAIEALSGIENWARTRNQTGTRFSNLLIDIASSPNTGAEIISYVARTNQFNALVMRDITRALPEYHYLRVLTALTPAERLQIVINSRQLKLESLEAQQLSRVLNASSDFGECSRLIANFGESSLYRLALQELKFLRASPENTAQRLGLVNQYDYPTCVVLAQFLFLSRLDQAWQKIELGKNESASQTQAELKVFYQTALQVISDFSDSFPEFAQLRKVHLFKISFQSNLDYLNQNLSLPQLLDARVQAQFERENLLVLTCDQKQQWTIKTIAAINAALETFPLRVMDLSNLDGFGLTQVISGAKEASARALFDPRSKVIEVTERLLALDIDDPKVRSELVLHLIYARHPSFRRDPLYAYKPECNSQAWLPASQVIDNFNSKPNYQVLLDDEFQRLQHEPGFQQSLELGIANSLGRLNRDLSPTERQAKTQELAQRISSICIRQDTHRVQVNLNLVDPRTLPFEMIKVQSHWLATGSVLVGAKDNFVLTKFANDWFFVPTSLAREDRIPPAPWDSTAQYLLLHLLGGERSSPAPSIEVTETLQRFLKSTLMLP